MNKANDEDFTPVMVVGMYRDNPAVRTLDYNDSLHSAQIAGFMTAILDCVVDMVDEQDQVQFEEDILEMFNYFIKNRFANTKKYKIQE
jgi:hypothetical protein